jgi:hypothetical protein
VIEIATQTDSKAVPAPECEDRFSDMVEGLDVTLANVETNITIAQMKAGRELLGWSRWKLARKSVVSGGKITDFEKDRRVLSPFEISCVRRALEVGGVEFGVDGLILLRPKNEKASGASGGS